MSPRSNMCVMLLGSLIMSSVITNSVKARVVSTHKTNSLNDYPITHLTDFIRTLYATTANKGNNEPINDMENEIIPRNTLSNEQPSELLPLEDNQDSTRTLLPSFRKRSTRYCGSYLADALAMACRTSSYLSLFGKRSGGSKQGREAVAVENQEELWKWPFISVEKAHDMLTSQNQQLHRVTRGVHDECCVKGCSFKELTSYCAPAPKS